jgi:hypothetical protein
MLTIRKEQMAAFSAYMLRGFIERAHEHIAKAFPKDYARLKEAGTRELIQKGIDKGTRHGIDAERPVSALIDLMVEFGADFEAQPDRPWAMKILNHPTLSGQSKMESLCRRMTGPGTQS